MYLFLQILREEKDDPETAYRALVALGNTVCSTTELRIIIDAGSSIQLHAFKSQGNSLSPSQGAAVRKALPTIPSRFPEDRIKTVLREVEGLL